MYNKSTMGDKGRLPPIANGRRLCRPPDRSGQMYRERGKCIMAKLDLTKYGISGTTEIVHNPSYDELFAEETKPGLEGYE